MDVFSNYSDEHHGSRSVFEMCEIIGGGLWLTLGVR